MKILVFTSGIFIILGIMIKYFKWYWLISGYNTMSKEKKKNVDVKGLGNYIGNWMFIISFLIAAMAYLNEIGSTIGFIISNGALLLSIGFLLVGAQKFDKNTRKGGDRLIISIVVIFLSILVLGAIGMQVYGIREPGIEITDKSLRITGLYSYSEPLSNIERVELIETIPPIGRKINGFNVGQVRKGNFQVEGLGTGMVYLQNNNGPFVYIKTATKFIIINLKDPGRTEELFSKIEGAAL